MAQDDKAIEIEVLRYRPEQDSEPFFQSYTVPFAEDWSVLQGLQHIKDDLDGTLSFRWSLLCYAACPQYGMNPKFIGSGHMALIHRYNADSRDGGRDQRMEPVNEDDGVWGCTAIGYCSVVCPKQVDPANAINMYKIESTKDYFLRFMAPRGTRK